MSQEHRAAMLKMNSLAEALRYGRKLGIDREVIIQLWESEAPF